MGGLLYYQTPYTNIIIIHLLMFISACPLRQYLFLSHTRYMSIVLHVQYLWPGRDLSSHEPLGSQEGTLSNHFCKLSVSQLLSWNKANCSLSVFDKENSMESPLDLLYYIYNYYCGYAPCLPQSSCPSADFFVICCDCDCDHSVTVMWCFPCSTLVIKKRMEKKY